MIQLDDWGYPIIDPSPVPPLLEGLARRAVAACPTLALGLRNVEAPARTPAGAPRSARRH
jgi:ferredoxin